MLAWLSAARPRLWLREVGVGWLWLHHSQETQKKHSYLGLVGGVVEGSTVGSKVESQGCAAVIACSLMGSIDPQVKFSMYVRYMSAVGWCFSFWTFMGYIAQYAAYTGTNLWLSEWTDDSQRYLNQTYPTHMRDLRIGVFGALGMAQGECGRTALPTHLICVVQEGYALQGLQPAVQ